MGSISNENAPRSYENFIPRKVERRRRRRRRRRCRRRRYSRRSNGVVCYSFTRLFIVWRGFFDVLFTLTLRRCARETVGRHEWKQRRVREGDRDRV